MDKFNRRPSARGQARRLLVALLAFLLCGGAFAALFAFGNQAAPWVLGVYAFGLTLGALSQWQALRRNHRLWVSGLKFQSHQGPGFSTLEAAAIGELLTQMGPAGSALRRHFAACEVVARYNSGTGGVTTFQSRSPQPAPDHVVGSVFWFAVQGISSIVGCKFWADDEGLLTTLEFFTGGEDTSYLDWSALTFDVAPEGATRPAVPMMRPVISEPRWVYYRPEI